MNQKIKLIIGMIIGFFLSIGLDQWTKLLVVKHLMDRPPFVIWNGVFELYYLECFKVNRRFSCWLLW